MLNGWGTTVRLEDALCDAATLVRRALAHEGWDGPSREAFDQQCETWAHELTILAQNCAAAAAVTETTRATATAMSLGLPISSNTGSIRGFSP